MIRRQWVAVCLVGHRGNSCRGFYFLCGVFMISHRDGSGYNLL